MSAVARRRGWWLGAALLLAAVLLMAQAATLGGAVASAGEQPDQGAVSVFPAPGSQVVSPQAQIAFRGISPFQLGSVQVTGSQSGPHAGAIEGDSDGRGGSFVPTAPFVPGETVTVTTSLGIVGAPTGTYQFTVATPAGAISPKPAPLAHRSPADVVQLQSRPDLLPSRVQVVQRDPAAAPGDVFLAPQFGPVQNGPMIVDSSGDLVWFKPLPRGQLAADFRVQTYRGKPVLTWWQGYPAAGIGVGSNMIYDTFYRRVATVRAANGLTADLHEFMITPAGTALLTAYYPVYWDASSVHGSKQQIVLDSVVQEIDIPTGLLLFQWDSLDHVSLADSFQGLPTKSTQNPYDYFHINSVAVDDDANIVISARNTWAAYKVNHSSGAVMWALGGRESSFNMEPGTRFAFQHDVRVRGSGDRLLTLFDDGAGPPNVHRYSRGLELGLDFSHMTARRVGELDHAPPLLSEFEGNMQQLSDGHELIGWGQEPYFSEYGARGRILLDARLAGDTSSYRVYKFAWQGQPHGSPAAAARRSKKAMTVYASWNGATNVAVWEVFAGSSPNRMPAVTVVPRHGFETAIRIPAAAYVRVAALGAGGRVLGSSPTTHSG
jgi:Arylsulfotransferase (ASST)